MDIKNIEQIKIEVNVKTRKKAQKILEGLGLNINKAVEILLNQIINLGNLPYEMRDENGFTKKAFKKHKKYSDDSQLYYKTYTSGAELIKDSLK